MLITNKDKLKRFYSQHRIWQGIPGIERTKNGRIFLTFYSGHNTETFGNYCVLIKSDDSVTFSEPIATAFQDGKYRCFDPCLWIDPLNRLWFIWNSQPDEKVWASICENPDADELVWSEEFVIGNGLMINKPIVLTTGEWIFPIAVWLKKHTSEIFLSGRSLDTTEGSYVYKTCDNGKTFVKLGFADVKDRHFDEHMVIELENGVLMMLVRTFYGIGVSYSYDRGKNWSRGENSNLGGPCARFFIRRLNSGRILLINHYEFTGRNNLCALLSEDDGKTYKYSLLLDERSEVSYPDATEDDDGNIYITYDRERGGYKSSLEEAYKCAREILVAKITEQDIISGRLVSKDSYLKRVANKLGKFADEDKANRYFFDNDIDFAEEIFEKDDAIERVFERYSLNCISVGKKDLGKLDEMIHQFNISTPKNKELLIKIIGFLRTYPKVEREINPIIEKIKKYVEANLIDDISIPEIAEKLGISHYYLLHLFKSVMGTTIIEYRNTLRLTKSKFLLIGSEKSIADIATEVGFSSPSYFTEIFTANETISPTEYRKFHKN